jgi:hypothetical protein
MDECYQMRHTVPLSASAPLPSTVYGGYTSQVACIQSQLIASWVGEGKTSANSLPNSPHRPFQSVDGACRGHGDELSHYELSVYLILLNHMHALLIML